MLIALDTIVFGPNVPAGMDWAVIGLWACRMRKTADPCDPPITVRRMPGCQHWHLRDGRHRVIGSIIAGRTHIEAVEEDSSPEQR